MWKKVWLRDLYHSRGTPRYMTPPSNEIILAPV